MSDSRPLIATQWRALMDFYDALNCTSEPLFCPMFDVSEPCPVLPPSAYSARLLCMNGTVRVISVHGSNLSEHLRFKQTPPGHLSPSLAALSDLDILYLFTGFDVRDALPDDLWGLTKIRHANFGQMQLTGTLPQRLPSSMVNFAVQQTQVSGTVPSSYRSLPQLRSLRLSFNRLTGRAPVIDEFLSERKSGRPVRCELMGPSQEESNCLECDDPLCCASMCSTTTTTTTMTMTSALTSLPLVLTLPLGSSASSTLAPSAASLASITFAATPAPRPDALVGGIVGGVAALLLLLLIACAFALWRRRLRRAAPTASTNATNSTYVSIVLSSPPPAAEYAHGNIA